MARMLNANRVSAPPIEHQQGPFAAPRGRRPERVPRRGSLRRRTPSGRRMTLSGEYFIVDANGGMTPEMAPRMLRLLLRASISFWRRPAPPGGNAYLCAAPTFP